MTVVPIRPLALKCAKTDATASNTGVGEALAFRAIRLCLSTKWSPETKLKASLTPEKQRSELAKILFAVQRLLREANDGSVFASLELVSLLSTLDMFETGMFHQEILGVDKG